jgi:hypothetical protein
MVRHNLVKCVGDIALGEGENLWKKYFEQANQYCHMSDRYSLGLSPNWMFTPKNKEKFAYINRHILDIPFSKDRLRYDKLMVDVVHYRLALGQPNQAKFLEDLRNKLSISHEDVKGLIINLFPRKMQNRKGKVETIVASPNKVGQLVKDSYTYLEQNMDNSLYEELQKEVMRLTDILWGLMISSSSTDDNLIIGGVDKNNLDIDITALKKENREILKNIVYALHYFVDPHDEYTDFTPECGFDDDIKVLRNAPNKWEQQNNI